MTPAKKISFPLYVGISLGVAIVSIGVYCISQATDEFFMGDENDDGGDEFFNQIMAQIDIKKKHRASLFIQRSLARLFRANTAYRNKVYPTVRLFFLFCAHLSTNMCEIDSSQCYGLRYLFCCSGSSNLSGNIIWRGCRVAYGTLIRVK